MQSSEFYNAYVQHSGSSIYITIYGPKIVRDFKKNMACSIQYYTDMNIKLENN